MNLVCESHGKLCHMVSVKCVCVCVCVCVADGGGVR